MTVTGHCSRLQRKNTFRHGPWCERIERFTTRRTLVAAFFAIAPVLVTWPLAWHLADALVGGDDPLLNAWILAWDVHALTTNPVHLYDANIFFPFPLPLTYSETLLTGAALIAPVLWLTTNSVLAHNVLTLASLSLAGFGVYLLVRELTGHDLAAMLGGCIFAFSLYQQDQLIHVQLLQTGWLALAMLFLHRAMRRSRGRDFLLFGLFFVCEAWASYYLFFLECVAVGTFLIFEALTSRVEWQPKNLLRLAGTFALVGVFVIPPALPYRQTQQTFHFQWDLAIVGDFSAHPTDYLSASVQKLLYPAVLGRFQHPTFPAEHALFPGLATLALASLALIALLYGHPRRQAADGGRAAGLHWAQTREIGRYLAVLVVAFVLSFGPWLSVAGQAEPIPLPYLLLYRAMPGFSAMRVPARFELLVIFALSMLAGMGITWLDDLLRTRMSVLALCAVLGGLACMVVLDLLPVPRSMTPIPSGADVPPVYGWLRGQDPRAVVAEIPSTTLANFSYVYLSTYHWHPLINGISGFNPLQFGPISAQLDAFPEQAAIENLRSLGVRYVIAHRDTLTASTTRALDAADLQQLRLAVAATFGPAVVYELAPVQAQASLQDHAHLELPTEIGRGVPAAAVLSFANDTPGPLAIGRGQTVAIEVAANESAGNRSELPIVPGFIRAGDTLTQPIPIGLGSIAQSADRAQVRVHVTTPVDLQTSGVVQFVDFPTSSQKTGLLAALTRVQLSPVIHADATLQINVAARNIGRAVWLADTGNTPGAIGVAVRNWIGLDGAAVQANGTDLATAATHLDWNVNPGQEAAFTLVARTPTTPGRYTLVLDMLSESVTWFEDVDGGARTVVPVVVEP